MATQNDSQSTSDLDLDDPVSLSYETTRMYGLKKGSYFESKSRRHEKLSHCIEEDFNCYACGTINKFTIWDIVNTATDPHLIEVILNGTLGSFNCSKCSTVNVVDFETLFHDRNINLAVFRAIPGQEHEELVPPHVQDLREEFFADHHCRLVYTIDDLAEKVLIFGSELYDVEIEIMKLLLCQRYAIEVDRLFFLAAIEPKLIWRRKLTFVIEGEREGVFEQKVFPYWKWQERVRPLAVKIVPYSRFPKEVWPVVDRMWILELLRREGFLTKPMKTKSGII